MYLCNLEKEEKEEEVEELSDILENYEDLIEKYANFLTIPEYLDVYMYEYAGNKLEFWSIILKGINEKIKFLE